MATLLMVFEAIHSNVNLTVAHSGSIVSELTQLKLHLGFKLGFLYCTG